jgi:hypothetical protein
MMKSAVIGLAALSAVVVAMPASARDDYGRHEGWRNRHHSGVSVTVGRSYARECAVKVEKIHKPNGVTVTRRVRRCD